MLQRDRSPQARAQVAAKFGRQFDELCSGADQAVAYAVLGLLVRDIALEVRQALSNTVAGSTRLPPDVARRLAGDAIEVAAPVLQRSPVLIDEDLVHVVRTNAMQYALAVAGREHVSELVSEALVETGEAEVVMRLVDNAGASISQATMQRVVQDYAGNELIHARVIRRPELPYELVEQLIGVMGERLEWKLVRERQMSPDDARTLMNAVRERATISFTARAHVDGKLHQHLLAEFSAGQLSHERLLRFLRDGEIASLEIGLALHARLELNHVRRLLYHADRRYLAALCLAAGLATPHYLTLRMALEIAEDAMASRPANRGYGSDTIRFLQANTTSSATTRPSCGCCSATDCRPTTKTRLGRIRRPRAAWSAAAASPGRHAAAPCPQPVAALSTATVHRVERLRLHSARQHCYKRRLAPGGAGSLASDDQATFRVQPHNIEAEQALLGAILVNNDAFHRVGEYLLAEHFFEPVHARIFERCAERIGQGKLADPVTLKLLFEEDESLRELDGARYLVRLAQAADTIINAVEYGRLIHDLALKRGLIRVGEDAVNRAFDAGRPETGREQIELAEQELFGLAQEGESRGEFRPFPVVLSAAIRHIESAWNKVGKVSGIPTRITGIDQKLGGLQPSDLVILAGRPSMGKTALAVTIAANSASSANVSAEQGKARHANYVVGVFSLEMSAEQLATRLLSGKGRIESDRLRRGDIGEEDWPAVVRASQELGALPLFIDDTPALSIAALRTRARRLRRTQGLDLIVVDYLQLLRGTGTHSQSNRVQEITEITQGLKAMAKDLNVPVLALSQLSRAVESREDKRPMLSDLRESGSIEQDADVVMFVYREEYYLSRAIPTQREGEAKEKFDLRYQEWFQRCQAVHNRAEVIIAKQRHGPIGNVQLQFDANFGQFHDLEPGNYPEHLYS